MTLKSYTNPDFTLVQKIIFFALALALILLCIVIIRLVTKFFFGKEEYYDGDRSLSAAQASNVQLFFEMIISGASVTTFACSYVVCNHIYSLLQGMTGSATYKAWMPFINIWSEGKDFALLLLICISCVLNTIIDKLIIPLKRMNKEKKASIRMLAMFYAIIILIFLNTIGDESEYSPVMMYYLGLMVGRFVYFDASFIDFVHAIKNVFLNLYLLGMCLAVMGGLCFIGFKLGYLLERNYYIVGILYTHLFMLIAVFLIHHAYNIYKKVKRD